MIVEFFKRGTGGSTGPIDYFLGKDRNREHAKILSGDLEEVAELIDSSPYIKKYTAGCLSFYEDDLSDAKKKALMAAFEKTLFPGLTPDQYRIVWIEHKDKENAETGEKRLELNFLIPNVEITTGKRLQPFYAKADLNRVDDFKSIVNHKYQLFDPDDPMNRRSIKVAKNLPKDKKDFISDINIEVALAITEGLVSDRESLKSWMTDIGLEITRITKNQISVKNPNNPEGKPIPLKGEFYEQNFRHSEQSTELKREASERYRQEADSRYANCIERYKKLCESKSEYHLERYATRDRTDSAELTRQLEAQKNKPANQHRQDGAELERGHEEDARELTDSNTELEKGLADVKRIEPSNNRTSEAEKSSFFIEYSLGFDSTYFAYHEHQLRLRQQEQVQRYTSDEKPSQLPEITGGEHEYQQLQQTVMYSNRHEQTDVRRRIQNSERGQLNDVRSTVIADYRAAAAAAQRATEAARASITAHSNAEQNDKRTRELLQQIDNSLQYADRERKGDEKSYQTATESEAVREFITELGEQLNTAITEPFRAVSDRVKSKERDQRTIANDDLYRNREANSTIDPTTSKETGLSATVSRKIRGFGTENIFKALDELDRRRERRNDRGYDSPSPF
ncbi:relaxase/mobilization nuclease domain-containing protein [Acinetobacter sp. YH12201]|jgi:hypothetical protein|uniref:relaxase/mobilization nuclease domain-containing protein n=1 Tax=Acinetobacter sp. YH12201 TaxID=2601140 RepID=UPI0015D1DB83|nr:relaxase/mobilization nuclease domain-containing protein [Acinetobacter sp. YH12201]